MSRHPALQSKTPAWLSSLFLVLVLVLGVSASSLKLRFATSIPSQKIPRLRLNCEAMSCNSLGRQSEELIRRSRRSCKATAGVPPISAHNPWLKKNIHREPGLRLRWNFALPETGDFVSCVSWFMNIPFHPW